jgi:hypothetical protein
MDKLVLQIEEIPCPIYYVREVFQTSSYAREASMLPNLLKHNFPSSDSIKIYLICIY